MNKVFVFDLDDTLMDNVHDYAHSILEMARIIIRELGSKAPHVSVIIAKEEEIDKRRVQEINPATGQKFLYSMERFPGTMVATYQFFCEKANVKPDKDIEQELWDIGMLAFDKSRYKKQIRPDTFSVMQFLREQKDVAMLLSKGDKRVQDKKFAALRAGELFFRVRVVSNKTSETFREMVKGFEGHTWYSVGNDYEKDIVPALEVGYRGGFIPVETWEVIGRMEEIAAKVDRSRCVVLSNLGEIIERYREL